MVFSFMWLAGYVVCTDNLLISSGLWEYQPICTCVFFEINTSNTNYSKQIQQIWIWMKWEKVLSNQGNSVVIVCGRQYWTMKWNWNTQTQEKIFVLKSKTTYNQHLIEEIFCTSPYLSKLEYTVDFKWYFYHIYTPLIKYIQYRSSWTIHWLRSLHCIY